MVVSYSEQWLPHNEPRLVAQHQRDRGRHSGPARCRRMQKSPTTTAFMPQLIVVFFFFFGFLDSLPRRISQRPRSLSRRAPTMSRRPPQRQPPKCTKQSSPPSTRLPIKSFLSSSFFFSICSPSPASICCHNAVGLKKRCVGSWQWPKNIKKKFLFGSAQFETCSENAGRDCGIVAPREQTLQHAQAVSN